LSSNLLDKTRDKISSQAAFAGRPHTNSIITDTQLDLAIRRYRKADLNETARALRISVLQGIRNQFIDDQANGNGSLMGHTQWCKVHLGREHRGHVLKERYLSKIKAFPKVTELFQRIRADDIKIVLASSAKAQELRTYEKIAGIEGRVDVETSSDDAEKSKPHPDIFHAPGVPFSDAATALRSCACTR
jgi:beta-phosphoglucomutase-like phosphatase (HAD superfamily)